MSRNRRTRCQGSRSRRGVGRLRVTGPYFANGPGIQNRWPCHGHVQEVGPRGERRPGIRNRGGIKRSPCPRWGQGGGWVPMASGTQESGIKEESRVAISALGPRGRVGPRGERHPGMKSRHLRAGATGGGRGPVASGTYVELKSLLFLARPRRLVLFPPIRPVPPMPAIVVVIITFLNYGSDPSYL